MLDDKSLLEGLKKNDSLAIKQLYRQIFPLVQVFITNNNGSQDDARDLFQEAVLTLYEKVVGDNFVLTAQLKTYIYSVVRNLWLKRLKQQNRYYCTVIDVEELVEGVFVEDDMEALKQKNEAFVVMQDALNSLGEPCKSLLEAFYFKDKDMQTLSEIFGYTNAENAKTQKYKCLVRLKKIFFSKYHNLEK